MDIRTTFVSEKIVSSRQSANERDFQKAWSGLVDAHIVAQPSAWLHVRVHFEMMRVAISEGNRFEILGQVGRLLLAAPGSLLGRYPTGNTGRSDVSMFLPMDVPEHLKPVLKKASEKTEAR